MASNPLQALGVKPTVAVQQSQAGESVQASQARYESQQTQGQKSAAALGVRPAAGIPPSSPTQSTTQVKEQPVASNQVVAAPSGFMGGVTFYPINPLQNIVATGLEGISAFTAQQAESRQGFQYTPYAGGNLISEVGVGLGKTGLGVIGGMAGAGAMAVRGDVLGIGEGFVGAIKYTLEKGGEAVVKGATGQPFVEPATEAVANAALLVGGIKSIEKGVRGGVTRVREVIKPTDTQKLIKIADSLKKQSAAQDAITKENVAKIYKALDEADPAEVKYTKIRTQAPNISEAMRRAADEASKQKAKETRQANRIEQMRSQNPSMQSNDLQKAMKDFNKANEAQKKKSVRIGTGLGGTSPELQIVSEQVQRAVDYGKETSKRYGKTAFEGGRELIKTGGDVADSVRKTGGFIPITIQTQNQRQGIMAEIGRRKQDELRYINGQLPQQETKTGYDVGVRFKQGEKQDQTQNQIQKTAEDLITIGGTAIIGGAIAYNFFEGGGGGGTTGGNQTFGFGGGGGGGGGRGRKFMGGRRTSYAPSLLGIVTGKKASKAFKTQQVYGGFEIRGV